MTEKRGLNRRQICKRWIGLTIGSGVAGTLSISTLVSVLGFLSYAKKEQQVDSTPYLATEVKAPDFEAFPGRIIDAEVDKIPVKLVGVSHTREFTKQHYHVLEELVKSCCCAAFEMAPGLIKTTEVFNNAKSYYGTMVELCKRYDKSVVFLNPFSARGELLEEFVGLFGVCYGSFHSFKIISENSTRRDFFINSMKTTAGVYFFLGSPIASELLRSLLREDIPGFDGIENKINYYLINHSMDQTNVQTTNRLLSLPKKLTQQELRKGDYILFNFGNYHVDGVDYYLRHPIMRGIKSFLYRFTYDLVDYDVIVKFIPNGDSWEKVRLA